MGKTETSHGEVNRAAIAANRRFFTALWSATTIVSPDRFNTWPLLSRLAERADARLEIAPGLRPRPPLRGPWFVDLSREALVPLAERGGTPAQGEITALPFRDGSFDLVC